MKSTISYIPKPSMIEFEPFYDQGKCLAEMKAAGYCYVDVMEYSKTCLRISIAFGVGHFSINQKADPRLKYHAAHHKGSIWSETSSWNFYLKKSCGLNGLKLHLEGVMSKLGFEELEFKIYRSLPIQEMLYAEQKQSVNDLFACHG